LDLWASQHCWLLCSTQMEFVCYVFSKTTNSPKLTHKSHNFCFCQEKLPSWLPMMLTSKPASLGCLPESQRGSSGPNSLQWCSHDAVAQLYCPSGMLRQGAIRTSALNLFDT
jgi:hypothetical protein